MMSPEQRRSWRVPLLWLSVLIAVGIIWVLTQANIISQANLAVLFRLWPVVLVGIGLELLFGRRSRRLSSLIIFTTLAVVIILMIVGPSIGLGPQIELETAQYSEDMGSAQSADITVGIGLGNLSVTPLEGTETLFDADIEYVGEIQYRAEGDTERVIELQNNSGGSFLSFADAFNGLVSEEEAPVWNVGISRSLPVALTLTTGTGSATLDLTSLRLSHLVVESGTGNVTLLLPAVQFDEQPQPYDAEVSVGTGGGTLTFAENSAVNLRVESGTGSITIDVPDDAPVRLDAEVGTGSIDVPAFLIRIDNDSTIVGDEGVWETASYAAAPENARITIEFNGGTGSLTVR